MLKVYRIDTHIHSCLSPCAELDMHPAVLVEEAVRAGLDAFAVCDHNSAENAAAVVRAGKSAGVGIIPGIEITSEEEVHIIGLLPDLETALELQAQVYRRLPGKNDERAFGMQVIANEHAEVLGFNDRLLAGSTTWSVDQVVDAIHAVGGLAVASHVDREGFGIIGQLGMIPAGLPLDALEVSRRTALPKARAICAPRDELPILCASDAHKPEEVGCAATFALLAEPTAAELGLAFRAHQGRQILGGGRPMEDLALHILDIVQNSVDAGATSVEIELTEDPAGDRLVIEVLDNGPGMSAEVRAQATDPFFTTRTTRRVGMGLPLLADAARMAGGEIIIESPPGAGCRVCATFRYHHIDRAPIGDLETTILVLMAGHSTLDVSFRHRVGGKAFEIELSDLRAAGIDPATPEGLKVLREVLRRGESALPIRE